jgi:hypothetical protein
MRPAGVKRATPSRPFAPKPCTAMTARFGRLHAAE